MMKNKNTTTNKIANFNIPKNTIVFLNTTKLVFRILVKTKIKQQQQKLISESFVYSRYIFMQTIMLIY